MLPAFDSSTGRVSIGVVEVGPTLKEPLALDPVARATVTVAYRSEGVTAYRVAPGLVDQGGVGAMVYCDSRGTLLATIVVATPDEVECLELSRAVRGAMKERHDRLLRDQLGPPPYRFGWGEIESVDDPRGQHPGIVVRYAR
jgi:hypothetical protein